MVKFVNQGLHLENPADILPGRTRWRSPSNIAIVKYWGKLEHQLPRNPSISLTLSKAVSETSVAYHPKSKDADPFDINFSFEGKPNSQFADKIKLKFQQLESIFPFLSQLSFDIESSNSFPHSSGIASSASSMSALALCLCDIENELFGNLDDDQLFYRKASFVARICSGSASRSVFPYVSIWGKSESIEHSSDYFAIDIHQDVDPVFKTFHDDILIVSKEEKSVSSTAGHKLMDTNSFAEDRYNQARKNIHELYRIMKAGDIEAFGHLAEAEALTLHALMMSSFPSYILMKPATLEIIEKIRDFRTSENVPLFFTLDAGPNIHTLYPDEAKEKARAFIDSELKPLCQDQTIIYDQAGPGPEKY